MFPAAFDYRSPASLDEALSLLAEHGDSAKVMAGGQSLIPLLKLRFTQPELVVDIGRLKGISAVTQSGDWLKIGALTRHVALERNHELGGGWAIIPEAAHWIADPLVRNQGTIGGSICHADPSGDWGAVMLALDADLVAHSKSGERVIHARDFFQGPFTTALRADEILTEIRIPASNRPRAGVYNKLERKVGDFATVAVAVQVELNGGKVAKAGIGLTSVGATNIKAQAAEKAIEGHEPTDAIIAETARLAADASEPKTDVRGSAEFKKDVVRVFVQRGLKTAIARAQGVRK
ncbi:MAG TPA: xanthine dehydrogenase family protein subunit M [Candidatus Dormibacteraeota bacterium]|nr:xanthine dehydrogenase family protein subunit M [Candidatus Dormibacteraeota bacterium]